MGREFARFSVKLSETFDLGEGLDGESPGVTSANFYGPGGSHTDVTNSLESLNALASNNTKYTIIDINGSSAGGVTSGGGVIWSTGWVDTDGTNQVSNSATLTFTHNLGENAIFQVYASLDSSGNGSTFISGGVEAHSGNGWYNCVVTNVTSTTCDIFLANSGWRDTQQTGGAHAWTGTYIKVVASSSGSPAN